MNIKVGQTWRTRDIGNVDVVSRSGNRFMVGQGRQVYAVDTAGNVIFGDRRGDLVARVERLYIAGPMSGLPDLNFPAFHAEAAKYRARGAHVENPAEINPDPDMQWADAMRADIPRLLTCDGIVLLPGWDKSRGATLEYHIAQSLGMTITYPEQA